MNPNRTLPTSWSWASFGEVATVASNLVDPAKYQDLPHIAPNHIESRTGRLLPHTTVAEDGVTSPKHLFHPGQILYSKIRPYLAKVVEAAFDGLCSADMYPIDTALVPRFLFYWLLTSEFTQFASQVQGRTVLPKINRGQLEALPVPVAPRHEQERIVAAIEEQFSRLDAGAAALRRAGQNLKRMRSLGVTSLFDPLWPRVPLAEVLTLLSDCPHRTPIYTEGEGYPALRPRDVVGGELQLQTSARVSPHEYQLQTARHTPEADDIVYSRELSYGWAVELPDKPQICLSQGMVLLRTSLLPGFLTLFLNSHEGRQQADRAATGTAHPHINLRDIKQYQVPLAPHTEQKRVLALASELLSECDRASQAVVAAMGKGAALRNAILTSAFSGQLVPQNPNDEPASAILEQIAVQRASFNGRSPTRTRRIRAMQEEVTA